MEKAKKVAADIDSYIAGFPAEVQERMQQIRQLVHKTVPKATEAIRWGMPAFLLDRAYIVLFAAYKHHIGVYPVHSKDKELMASLSGYQAGKGSIQFPHDERLPLPLIKKIVRYNLKRLSK